MPEQDERPLEDVPMEIRGRIRELRDRLSADGIKIWTDEDSIKVGFIWDRDPIMQTAEQGEYKLTAVMLGNMDDAQPLLDQVGDLSRVTPQNVHVTRDSIRINASLGFEA